MVQGSGSTPEQGPMPHGVAVVNQIFTMDYSFYLFCQLHDEIRGTKNSKMPYDLKFEMLQGEYQAYLDGGFDSQNKHMYDCMHDYLKSVSFGSSGILSHSPELTWKYNKLLKMFGTDGILLQVENLMSSNELSALIERIEFNVTKSFNELPY